MTSLPAALTLLLVFVSSCSPIRAPRVISTSAAPAPIGAYSQAIRSGSAVYVAGQIALDPGTGELIPDSSVEAQTRRSLENLRAILAAAGLSFADVVSTQVFLADIEDARRLNAVYSEYFPRNPPARFVVGVSGLPRGARVEIGAIAACP